jgi:hypothetical protein
MLGCYNNRNEQMKKVAKAVALRLGMDKTNAKN